MPTDAEMAADIGEPTEIDVAIEECMKQSLHATPQGEARENDPKKTA
jgi:hypothetical protein